MNVDFDKFGYCVLCHRNMTIEEVIDNKVQIRFTSEYIEEEFLLTDGSKMRVAMCISCKENHTEKDYTKIMQSVKDGWEKEIENWQPEKSKKYREYYYKLEIITKSLGKSLDILEKELKDFKHKKDEKVK